MTRSKAVLLAAFGFAVFMAIWEAAPALDIVPASVLPPPSALPRAFMREFNSGIWISSLLLSLRNYLAGLVIGCSLGVMLGIGQRQGGTPGAAEHMPALDAELS